MKVPKRGTILLVAIIMQLVVLLPLANAQETTITFQQGANGYTGCEDTYIYRWAANSNYSSNSLVKVGYKQQNAALVGFDLSSIPTDAVVTEATLQVYAVGWSGANISMDVYGIIRHVTLSQVTWNQAQAGNPWGAPGCNDTTSDRLATPDSSVTTSGIRTWYSLDLTSLVQQWVNGSVPNNGVLLRTTATYATNTFYFASAENGSSDLRPRLILTYTSLEPCVPTLMSPAEGAILDNGRYDRTDAIIWDFDWSDCPGAAAYHLYVYHLGAEFPTIDEDNLTESSYNYFCPECYITSANLDNWTWKVRARVNNEWGEWSEVRYFYVEPPDTDPPPPTSPWPMFRYNTQHTGRSLNIGPTTPQLRWRFPTGGAIRSSPAIAADGTLFVGSSDGYLYAINPNGSLRWHYMTGDAIESSPAIGTEETIYVGSNDGYLYAINADGSLRWRYPIGVPVQSSPNIATDGTIYVGANDGHLYAFNPDGTLQWRHYVTSIPPRLRVYSSPAIVNDGTIYVGTPSGELYAINPNGSQKWIGWFVSADAWSSPAIADDGNIYVGCEYRGCLGAFRPDGSLIGCYEIPYGANVTSSPAIGNDGTIYVGVDSSGAGMPYPNGYLAAFDPAGDPYGPPKWRFVTDGGVNSSPAIGADGTIYVGSNDGYIYAINSDGTMKWRYQTGGIVYSSPAIGADRTVYVGSDDGYLYAIETTITLQQGVDGYSGCEDTYIYRWAPNTNYSSNSLLKVGYKQQNAALVRFDLSSIPTDAVVTQATLQVYAVGWSGANITMDVYGVIRDVTISQATWNQAQAGNPWGAPGCNDTTSDRLATPESSVTTSGIRTWYSLDLTSLVQQWVNGSVPNNGVLLRTTATYATNTFYFDSAEDATVNIRPKLVIAYQ